MLKFIKNYSFAFIVLCIGVILTVLLCLGILYSERLHVKYAVHMNMPIVKGLSIHQHGAILLLVIFCFGILITFVLFFFLINREKYERKLQQDKGFLQKNLLVEEKYRILFETSRDAIMTLDPPNWLFTSGNQATVEMFKCKNEKYFLSFAPYELSPEFQPDGKSSKEKALEMINIAMKKGSNFFEWLHRNADGEEFLAAVSLIRVEIEKGKPFLQATVRDITKQKEAEIEILEKTKQLEELNKNLEKIVTERTRELNDKNVELHEAHEKLKNSVESLVQAEKMSALGEFAAGTVHELNNPLTGALNFIQYAIKHTELKDKKYNILKDTEKEIERCITITKNLLFFARSGKEKQEEIVAEFISVIVKRVLLLLAYRIKKDNIQIITHFPENPVKILVRPNKMQQALLNLVVNAMDALQDSETKKITITEENTNKSVTITIEDTGCGIEPDKLDKIFDAFYTTKPKGIGTGLGLSIVKHIVATEHHGSIKCESELGKGTKFIIELPLTEERK
ncbi:MAG: ATP-binding protein [Gammaproteobacteria bacterium]|jgi:C4-dicarboxylate-specific signal transduction histidine kinase